MKHILASLLLIFSLCAIHGQRVPLHTILEHFTNTKCSICFNKNPGLYANLAKHPSVLYLSIHPSSPYAACILSQQNKVNNDNRTHYYEVYGGTPVIVINGQEISGVAFTDTTLFNSYLGQTSAFAVSVKTMKSTQNEMQARVVIKKVDSSNLQTATLFTSIAEDTVFVNGGNGEQRHYNVSRTSFQENIALPSEVNDSITWLKTVTINPVWNIERMFSVAILQEVVTKKLIQANKSALIEDAISSATHNVDEEKMFKVFPNPVSDFFTIQNSEVGHDGDQDAMEYELYTTIGNSVLKGSYVTKACIDVRHQTNGLYYLVIKNKDSFTTKAVVICK